MMQSFQDSRRRRVALSIWQASGPTMAWSTLDGVAEHAKVKIVCAAEVDSSRLTKLKGKFPEARIYQDWREMLRKERHNLDAFCVGTPDHMHAPTAMSSMQLGLHVYGQKPLAHDIFECRKLMEMAAKKKLINPKPQCGSNRRGLTLPHNSCYSYRRAVIASIRRALLAGR